MIRIEAAQLIDAASDAPRRPGILSIDGDRIAAVGDAGGVPGPATPARPRGGGEDLVLSLPGCTLLPGLIDFHSHLGIDTRHSDLRTQVEAPPARYVAAGIARIQEDLRAGVTTMRLCGDRHGADLAVRDAVEDGRILAPRLRAAGRAVRSPRCRGGSVASVFTDEVEGVSQAAAEALDAGADFVKLFVSDGVGDPAVDPTICYYGEAHVAAASRRAHAAGRPVAAHLLGGPGVAAAVGGGVDVIEHGWFLTDADLDLIARREVLMTLTLGVLCGPRGHAFGGNPAQLARLRALGEVASATARKVIARGIRYVVGTDAVHGCLADEIAWLAALGERPMRAIQAATAWPAAALGLGTLVGTLERGKAADVIAVEGDPLADPGAVGRVRLVVSRGRIVHLDVAEAQA